MHRRPIGVAVLAGIVTALAFSVPASTQERGRARSRIEQVNGRDAVAGEVLVRFRRTLGAQELAQIGALVDADSNGRLGRIGLRRLRSRFMDAASLVALLANHDDVAYAEPNYIVRVLSEPNDPSFAQLWGLKNLGQAVNGIPGTVGADIHAVDAWDISVGSTDNVVGIIDTGIDYTHPDLAANMWSAPSDFTVTIDQQSITCPAGSHGFNAITLTCNPMDDHHHGTHVAGTVGAVGNNGIGVVGVNWTTQLMGLKFLDAAGSGTTADAINSIDFAIQAKQAFGATGGANVRVLSNSWGGHEFSQALLDEINAANDANILFVAGAGNSGLPNDWLPFYPATHDAPNVVSVAATDNNDSLAWFSNWGTTTVHLAAPGVDILSTVPGGSYAFLSGTSMATPHVSGAAALVLSRCDLNTSDLKETLLSTAEPVAGLELFTITGARLDVNSAIHSCIAPPPTPAGLTAVAGDLKVTLGWPAVSGALRYSVKRSDVSGGPFTVIASNVKATAYVDSAVVNGTPYYYVLSASNFAGESGDSNEATATPRVPPDLTISSLTVPATGGAGAAIVVSETTRNQGAGAAVASTTRFYLSSNSTFDAGDVLLDGVHDVPLLAASATSVTSISLVIPSGTLAGNRYVIARADADNVISESHESNNSLARAIQIGPDLTITALMVPATAVAGSQITLTDTVKNKGGGSAGASSTAFYLSANTNIDSNDILLPGSRALSELAAGVSSVGNTTLTVPSTVPAGTYYVIALADADGEVAEVFETNNDLARVTDVGGDLVVSSLTAPAKAAAGSDMSVTETTTNQGVGGVSESTTRFYLSVNTSYSVGDTPLVGSHAVPNLAAGGYSTSTTTVTIPGGVEPGPYYLLARADPDDVVSEVSNSNNTRARSILIGGDLIVAALTVPAKVAAGSDIVVADTVTNQGGDSVPTTLTRFYLSSNSAYDAGDTLLTGSRTVPELPAGATSPGSTTVTIPSATVPGSYYVIARADADDVVAETSESNNSLARLITLGGDLVVSALTVPAKIGPGSDITVSETTTNQGEGSVTASSTRYYLSANTVVDASDTLLAGSHAVPELAAGASSPGTTSVTIPAMIVPGTYYFIAKADGENVIGEASEGNNSLARSTQIGGDLIVSALTVPAKAGAGTDILASDTTANQGGGGVPSSALRFYLSSNTVLDAGDLLLGGSRLVTELATGASSPGQTTVTIPSNVAPAAYYVIARADADNAVAETVENNNILSRSIQIGGDLIVSTLTGPASAPSGSSIVLTDTTTNQGGGAVAASTTRFYFSTNPTFDVSDTLLPHDRAVPALAPGEFSAGPTTIVIPLGLTPKTYYLIAVADGDDVVAERIETNNTKAKPISVTAGP